MSDEKKCPKCGKPMTENKGWRGLWVCPDYKHALNDKPPFRYKCNGTILTDEGVAEFDEAVMRIMAERN